MNDVAPGPTSTEGVIVEWGDANGERGHARFAATRPLPKLATKTHIIKIWPPW